MRPEFHSPNIFAKREDVQAVELSELAAGGSVQFNYVRRSVNGVGTHSYRFTQNATTTMYFAGHNSTGSLRAYRWPESGGVVWNDIVVPTWSGNMIAIAPNGVNWGGRSDGRITGGYVRPGEYGFLWTSGPVGAARPRCFVRAIRVNSVTNNPIASEDLFSPTYDFLYPAAAVNARGDVGICAAVGSVAEHPTSAFMMLDSCRPNLSGQVFSFSRGNASPSLADSWGDYFSVQRHAYLGNTFVASGMTLRGGGANGNLEPQYVHFGREQDQVAEPTLDVTSTGAQAVPITLSVQDRAGLQDGTTDFSRRFAPGQTYRGTAPASRLVFGRTYSFARWSWRSSPSGAFINQPLGQLTFEAGIGTTSDALVAQYEALAGVVVRSTNPASGVAITVSRTDFFGARNGVTPFTRSYIPSSVSLTAPATVGINPFKQWIVENVAQPIGQRTVSVSMAQSGIGYGATAVYINRVQGLFTQFGAACSGTAGTPTHSATGVPETGSTVNYLLTGARALTNSYVLFGFSNTSYAGIPLPLDLGCIGITGCNLHVSNDVSVAFATNGAGVGSIPFTISNSPWFVGVHLGSTSTRRRCSWMSAMAGRRP